MCNTPPRCIVVCVSWLVQEGASPAHIAVAEANLRGLIILWDAGANVLDVIDKVSCCSG